MSVRQQPDDATRPPFRANRAIRLKFAYEGEEVRMVSRQPLQKRTAPSDPVDAREKRNQSGFWIELQGARNRTLYRRIMSSPIETSVEVPTGNPEQPFIRHPVERPQGVFFLIVPDLDEAESVAIYSSPPESATGGVTERAREIARFDLRREPDYGDDSSPVRKGGAR